MAIPRHLAGPTALPSLAARSDQLAERWIEPSPCVGPTPANSCCQRRITHLGVPRGQLAVCNSPPNNLRRVKPLLGDANARRARLGLSLARRMHGLTASHATAASPHAGLETGAALSSKPAATYAIHGARPRFGTTRALSGARPFLQHRGPSDRKVDERALDALQSLDEDIEGSSIDIRSRLTMNAYDHESSVTMARAARASTLAESCAPSRAHGTVPTRPHTDSPIRRVELTPQDLATANLRRHARAVLDLPHNSTLVLDLTALRRLEPAPARRLVNWLQDIARLGRSVRLENVPADLHCALEALGIVAIEPIRLVASPDADHGSHFPCPSPGSDS